MVETVRTTSAATISFQKFGQKPDSFWNDFPERFSFSIKTTQTAVPNVEPTFTRIKVSAVTWKENKEEWLAFCGKIQAGLGSNQWQKIVPSRFRKTTLTLAQATELKSKIIPLLSAHAPKNSYQFLYCQGENCFFGASPELLYERKDGFIQIPAIAGTIVLSDTDDEAEIREFLQSGKNLWEHKLVVDGICEQIKSLGLDPQKQSEPEILRFGRLVHLYTPIRCRDPGKDLLKSSTLISALHPTPAIGGLPQKAALSFLQEFEPWSRGLFASPITISYPNGEEICIVAIRSALLKGNEFYQFAGAGYVQGSDPELEWQETDKKMNSVWNLFFEEQL